MARSRFWAEVIRILKAALTAGLRSAQTTETRRTPSTTRRTTKRTTRSTTSRSATSSRTSSSSTADPAKLNLNYDAQDDDRPDPGEVVWTWVPYEENDGRGKDRPVLVIARRRGTSKLVGLMLTSKDHDRDEAQERRYGRHWMDIGAGTWDSQRRPSEVRLDRLIDVDPEAVRRQTALDRERFDQVAAAFRALHQDS